MRRNRSAFLLGMATSAEEAHWPVIPPLVLLPVCPCRRALLEHTAQLWEHGHSPSPVTRPRREAHRSHSGDVPYCRPRHAPLQPLTTPLHPT